jgi:uncharacterized protein YkwD
MAARMTLRTQRHMLAAFALASFAAFFVLTGCTAETTAEMQATQGINGIRSAHGLPPLAADANLTAVARARSKDMAARNYFSHQPPDGCNYVCLMDSNGIPHAYAGENIAWNTWQWDQTSQVAVKMWNNSPPHLQNIVNCHYERVGTGVAKAKDGKVYFTMVFEGNAAC